MLKMLNRNRTAFFRAATVGICVMSVVYANVFVMMGRTHSYEIKDIMIDTLIEGDVDLGDGDQFRIDTYDCVDNTSMYLGYKGINAFHSVVPSSIMSFYEFIGEERSVGSRPTTDVAAIRPLLSVKYLLNRSSGDSFVDENGETLMAGYKYLRTENDYYIYENENYIPYGFSYDYYMTEEFCESYSKSTRAELMLKAVLLSEEQIKKYSYCLENLEDVRSMGYFGDSNGVRLAFSDEEIAKDSARLAETSASSFEITENGFKATVSRESDNLVFFSVPYEKGWSATVNGAPAEIEKVNVGFMAVAVKGGDSEIVFTYKTPGLTLGLMITVITAIISIIYIFVANIIVSRRSGEEFYPEGEQLIEKWRSDAIAEQVALRALEDDEDRYSLPDDEKGVEIPKLNDGFEGGFSIDLSKFNEK